MKLAFYYFAHAHFFDLNEGTLLSRHSTFQVR